MTAGRVRRIVRIAFLTWAVVSTAWLANSVRTQGVSDAALRSDTHVKVLDRAEFLSFEPAAPASLADRPSLLFFCGAGVAAEAYGPLLRPIAEAGFRVVVVRLPYRFAPLESQRREALERARQVLDTGGPVGHWVVSGHSLGGALTARLLESADPRIAAAVLIATTHPRERDLSGLSLPVTKVYGTLDGVAPAEDVLSGASRLPVRTRWVRIDGGNHSQFGHYGRQLFDGEATIGREAQQRIAREALREALDRASTPPRASVAGSGS